MIKKYMSMIAGILLSQNHVVAVISDNGQQILDLSGNTVSVGDLISGDGLINNLDFRTMDNVRARIDQNGNFGVKTISPQRTLDVNGTFRAASIEGNGVFPVTNYGAIANDGLDDQAAFVSALSAAALGRGTVLVPPGQFKLTGTLTIPAGVTFKGSWESAHDASLGMGTVLLTTANAGQTTGTPFIQMAWSSTVKGFTIYYPNQTASSFTAYPYTIAGSAGDCTIENVTFANSYQGIDFSAHHDRLRISNVNMTALRFGVLVDNSVDVDRLEGIHILNAFFTNAIEMSSAEKTALNNFTMANLWGFRIRNVDGLIMDKCFVISAYIGMAFQVSPANPEGDTDPRPWAHISNSIVDHAGSNLALYIEESHSLCGLTFVNCNFTGNAQIGSGNLGHVRFLNSSFIFDGEPSGTLIEKYGSGTLSVVGCHFHNWITDAIRVKNGAALINTSDFSVTNPGYAPNANQVHVLAGAQASVVGNYYRTRNGLVADAGARLDSLANIYVP